MTPFEYIAVLVFLVIFAIALALAITVPLLETLVRFRANFNPKGLQLELDPEDGVEPYTGPVVTGYFEMMRRVKRLEGVAGLYKGLMPTPLYLAFFGPFLAIAYGTGSMLARTWVARSATAAVAYGILLEGIFLALVSFPALIIRFRAITTPHRLPYLAPEYSLRVLLTPTERRRPWALYLTPGLPAAWAFHIIYELGLRVLRDTPLPGMTNYQDIYWAFYLGRVSWLRAGLFFGTIIASTIVLCPLEVATTRLAIQHNHTATEYSLVMEEEADSEDTLDYAGASQEDAISLRSEMDPYLGLSDCVQTIVREEGWTNLYRGWWITLVLKIFSIFTTVYA